MIRVLDNALPAFDFKKVHDEAMQYDFPWNYGRKGNHEPVTNPFLYGFVRTVMFDGAVLYDPYGTFERSARLALKYAGEKVKDIIRIRVILNTVADKNYEFGPHVDIAQPHRVGILYLNDSDGDTIIYNERFNPILYKVKEEFDVDHLSIPQNLTIQGTVSPKANRLVIFDGQNYHCGQTPTKTPRRIALNIGYTTEEEIVPTHTPIPTLTIS
jgi:hypothetical protein